MDTTMNEYSRSKLLEKVRKDLLGPLLGEHEELTTINGNRAPLPDDVYLTGLLLPQELNSSPDDELEVAIDDDSGGVFDAQTSQTNDPGEPVPGVFSARPSVMGLSFAVSRDTKAIDIEFTGARYLPFWEKGDTRIFDKTDQVEQEASWIRSPRRFVGTLSLSDIDTKRRGLLEIQLIDKNDRECTELRCLARVLLYQNYLQITITTQNILTQEAGGFSRNISTWFQTKVRVQVSNGKFRPRPNIKTSTEDQDERSNQLLYRNVHQWAIGHTCSASWNDDTSPTVIESSWLPQQKVYSMSADGHSFFRESLKDRNTSNLAHVLGNASSPNHLAQLLSYLPNSYKKWIKEQESYLSTIQEDLLVTAHEHIANAKEALRRIQEGIETLKTNEMAYESFRLSQKAMHRQSIWKDKNRPLQWRPFQLGFQLASITSIVSPKSSKGEITKERNTMDLLWFPTGGGKTEAYLGLSSFTLFYRRLRDRNKKHEGAGVSILMRYTLRLLTTQQFERSAAMIFACEVERRQFWSQNNWTSDQPFSVGLYVGNSTTPNSLLDVHKNNDEHNKAKMLKKCPFCGNVLIWETRNNTLEVFCRPNRRSKNCELSEKIFGVLPVYTVDEIIFEKRPSLVLGTVDKFAQIVRTQSFDQKDSRSKLKIHGGSRLFGGGTYTPPELIIQDELHLISGPLGTITAIYEAAIDRICYNEGIPPKIIGSTATIRRAESQVRLLFDRDVFQFPPSVLDPKDSCFAVADTTIPGRIYVGLTTAGRSAKFSLAQLKASLLQRALELPKEDRDPWWTVLAYYNSLRELGGSLVMIHDDVPAAMKIRSDLMNLPLRDISGVRELTSRLKSDEIPEILDQINKAYTDIDNKQDIDVLLATNMISVGVDIPRLGLMIVNGQPRSMAEYIQASSRVGRNKVPGVIYTIYNAYRPRDLSRYEAFRVWHQALYKDIEATSVTPYAERAREKALHSTLVILARHLITNLRDNPAELTKEDYNSLKELGRFIVKRAQRAEPIYKVDDKVEQELEAFLESWWTRKNDLKQYWSDHNPSKSLLYSWEEEARRNQTEDTIPGTRPTPNSMRDVEPSVWFRLVESLR